MVTPSFFKMDLLVSRKLEIGSRHDFIHMFLILQLDTDGQDDLASVR